MATVDSIDIIFNFSNGNGDSAHHDETFDPADSSLLSVVEEHRDEWLDELNDGCEDEWVFDSWDVDNYDSDWSDPGEFSTLDDYGEYCENVEKFGEAFHLRYDDVGEITGRDFEDAYNGCWDSFQEYVENYVDDCMEVPDSMKSYFDYEKFANDLQDDFNVYDGADGVHIFQDC